MRKTQGEQFELSLQRPRDYFSLSSQRQWEIDTNLGILDWNGSCLHQKGYLCSECKDRFNKHFGLKK